MPHQNPDRAPKTSQVEAVPDAGSDIRPDQPPTPDAAPRISEVEATPDHAEAEERGDA